MNVYDTICYHRIKINNLSSAYILGYLSIGHVSWLLKTSVLETFSCPSMQHERKLGYEPKRKKNVKGNDYVDGFPLGQWLIKIDWESAGPSFIVHQIMSSRWPKHDISFRKLNKILTYLSESVWMGTNTYLKPKVKINLVDLKMLARKSSIEFDYY